MGIFSAGARGTGDEHVIKAPRLKIQGDNLHKSEFSMGLALDFELRLPLSKEISVSAIIDRSSKVGFLGK